MGGLPAAELSRLRKLPTPPPPLASERRRERGLRGTTMVKECDEEAGAVFEGLSPSTKDTEDVDEGRAGLELSSGLGLPQVQ